MRNLTDRQSQILELIRKHIHDTGYPPTRADIAKELGYKAMQFNFVASSNEGAVKLWEKLGFEIVGRLPKAFNHPAKGYVEALVMYKWIY